MDCKESVFDELDDLVDKVLSMPPESVPPTPDDPESAPVPPDHESKPCK